MLLKEKEEHKKDWKKCKAEWIEADAKLEKVNQVKKEIRESAKLEKALEEANRKLKLIQDYCMTKKAVHTDMDTQQYARDHKAPFFNHLEALDLLIDHRDKRRKLRKME